MKIEGWNEHSPLETLDSEKLGTLNPAISVTKSSSSVNVLERKWIIILKMGQQDSFSIKILNKYHKFSGKIIILNETINVRRINLLNFSFYWNNY